jgi:feruloyl esterase
MPLFPVFLLLTRLVQPSDAAAPGRACDGLKTLSLPRTTISGAAVVPAGGFTPPGGKPISGLPAFCRVSGSIAPSSDSDIQFEVWMPASGWNGKFRGIGNGGFAGSISYRQLAAAVARGYAAASTDTGHRAGDNPTEAPWALGHPEKVIDFGYRAIHEMTDKGKAIVRAFYGQGPRRSYFAACSNGGRQALMEAQRFPGDYDGVIAGAPANFLTHLLAQGAWELQKMEAGYIPSSKLPAIEAATLAACDAADGLADQVLDDPRRCAFDPGSLLCKGADSPDCLTAAQVSTLRSLYTGPRTHAGPLHPPHLPGGVTGPDSWTRWITGPTQGQSLQAGFTTSFFRFMVHERPDWEPARFDLERDTRLADHKLGRALNAVDPDLRPFGRRGAKLILYHGWSDPPISPLNTIDYYQKVVARAGAKVAEGFIRLFMAPGMLHCSGGQGPGNFLGDSAQQADADHDMYLALERWVEEGVAPARIIAARYKEGADPRSGVLRTRPLCPYPQVARWTGSGSTDEAASFTCTAPRAADPHQGGAHR